MKTHTTVTIDIELIEKAKKMNINVSGAFNEYLRNVVAQSSGDLADINYELLCADINRLTNKKLKIDAELQQKVRTRERIDDEMKERDEQKLLDEKKKIEDSKKCIECGRILEEGNKFHTFKKGTVCNGCFMNVGNIKFKGWNNG